MPPLFSPGLDFLTILGAHEGEGLVVEVEAEVAGSRSALIADKGQKASNISLSLLSGVQGCTKV